jgi:pimeloyl-ACP methyl ester carboxylesterase
MSKTIMLIHGAWLNSRSWEGFKARYEAQGYTVIAPDWPYDDRDPAELRASPRKELAHLGQTALVDHYDKLIRALPEEPILIGHSIGGVVVQHLLDRGLGVVGVAIDSAPTPGVPLGLHAIRSVLPVFLDPFSWRKVKFMSRRFFRKRFAQTAPKHQADALYDRYIVPTPGKIYWDGIINTLKIRWENPRRPPLLMIAGELDLIADASMIRRIYRKQCRAPSTTAYKEFAGRSHWTCLDAGWEKVADVALAWAVSHARPARPASLIEARAA